MVEVCAEIGINHGGDMDLAHEMIRQAAIAGADFVKFQLYNPDEIFGHLVSDIDLDIPLNEGDLDYEAVSTYEEAWKCNLRREHFNMINDWCREERIKPMYSVFDEERLGWLTEYGLDNFEYIKIASRTARKRTTADKNLLNKINEIGVKTLTAFGFAENKMPASKEIKSINKILRSNKNLYCVSKYPAEYKDYSANAPSEYDDSKNYYYGISDHTMGIATSLIAVAHGAMFVEKHFTLSKTLKGSDHKCSITPDELSDLVKYSRQISIARGQN